MTVSWWSSRADIEGFAGYDIDVAVFYPGMTATSSAGRPLSRTMRWRRRCDTTRTSWDRALDVPRGARTGAAGWWLTVGGASSFGSGASTPAAAHASILASPVLRWLDGL
jgi:hypothetical protein